VADTLIGGNGNDRFRVRDGEADKISCGEGTDIVRADEFDVIVDSTSQNKLGSCERVDVKPASTESDSPENEVESEKEDKQEG